MGIVKRRRPQEIGSDSDMKNYDGSYTMTKIELE